MKHIRALNVVNLHYKDLKARNPLFLVQFPFHHWHNERIPERTEPSDRRQAREEREIERQRQIQAVKQQEIRDRQRDEREKR